MKLTQSFLTLRRGRNMMWVDLTLPTRMVEWAEASQVLGVE